MRRLAVKRRFLLSWPLASTLAAAITWLVCLLLMTLAAHGQSTLSEGYAKEVAPLSPAERAGSEIWFNATAFNDRFFTYGFQQRLGGAIDWYGILAAEKKADIFQAWGGIPDPDCCVPGQPNCPAKSLGEAATEVDELGYMMRASRLTGHRAQQGGGRFQTVETLEQHGHTGESDDKLCHRARLGKGLDRRGEHVERSVELSVRGVQACGVASHEAREEADAVLPDELDAFVPGRQRPLRIRL